MQQASIFDGAQKLKSIQTSLIRTVMDKSKAMADAGLPVVPLVAGEPDLDTPMMIKQATMDALQENLTHYTSNRGYPQLRQAIAEQTLLDTGLSYDFETEILVTSGCAEAINNAMFAVLDPGDEVIVFSPAFVNYENVARLCGSTVISIPLRPENGFQIDVAEVETAITDKTKLIVINNPCNPTGVLYQQDVLEKLCALAIQHDLLVVSDEIYSRLVYDNLPFKSLATFPGMRERTIVLNGFSKTYAMTGWRLGYLLCDKRLMPSIVKVHQYSTTCSPTFLQAGLSRVMRQADTQQSVDDMVRIFTERRKLVLDRLDQIRGLSYVRPEGAFYVFIDVSGTGLNGVEFADRLLAETYLAVVPGVGLGKECTDFIRISYATSKKNLEEGMDRLSEFVARIMPTHSL